MLLKLYGAGAFALYLWLILIFWVVPRWSIYIRPISLYFLPSPENEPQTAVGMGVALFLSLMLTFLAWPISSCIITGIMWRHRHDREKMAESRR